MKKRSLGDPHYVGCPVEALGSFLCKCDEIFAFHNEGRVADLEMENERLRRREPLDAMKSLRERIVSRSENPEARAIRVMAKEFEKLGEEPCSECGWSLNEIRDYVHEVLALRKVAEKARALRGGGRIDLRDQRTLGLYALLGDALDALPEKKDGGA